jgi:hypothetical protein
MVSRLLLALAFAGLCAIQPVHAQETAAARPKAVFPPEIEAKFADFLKKVTEAKRQVLNQQMERQIQDLQKVTGLGPEPVKALEAAAGQAVDLYLPKWSAKLDEMIRQGYGGARPSQQMLAALEAMMLHPAAYAAADWPGVTAEPMEETTWTDALRRTLSPEQLTAWDKVQAEHQAALDKEIGGYLDAQVDKARQKDRQLMQAKASGIARLVGLSDERAGQLNALGRSAADQAAEAAKGSTRKVLLAMSEAQRTQIIKNQGFFMANDENAMPERLAMWRDGLAKLLSPDEQKILQAAQEEHKRERTRAAAQLLLALLDEKIAFSAAQRQQLQPIAERLVQTEPSLFPEANTAGYVSFSPRTFDTVAAKAAPGDLRAILDPVQCQRWEEIKVRGEADRGEDPEEFPPNAAAPPAEATPAPAPGEPEDVEQDISDFLYPKAERERKRTVAFMVLQAEDAARINALAADRGARLQTAARGAAEESLGDWKSNLEQVVRSQMQDATPQDVKVRLDNIQDYYFRQIGEAPEQTSLWKKTVQTELTEPQRTAWQKEVDARGLYHDTAIASFITAEFDRQNPLTPEQWDKIVPLVAGVLKDYSPDIARMFSYNMDQNPWYLQGYTLFLPFAGMPEKDLKAILSPEQWQRWTGSEEYGNVTSYWSTIQTMHDQMKKMRNQGAPVINF